MLRQESEFENRISSEAMKIDWNWNEFSDYGSANSSGSSTMSWGGQDQCRPDQWSSRPDRWSARPEPVAMSLHQKQKSASFVDLITSGRTLNDVMQEFQMNGFDSPYNPDEDMPRADGLSGVGPSAVLLRQKSWPDPERTPIQRLPNRWSASDLTPSLVPEAMPLAPQYSEVTEEQRRVLASLPQGVVRALLRGFEEEYAQPVTDKRPDCRFCRNNGERESYCRSHSLKDADGNVRCPVLRALRCRRCGARGDRAHTIKYCPLATPEERIKSTAMMRSVRLASGRRRQAAEPEYVMFGAPPRGNDLEPLHPLWAALEQKLML